MMISDMDILGCIGYHINDLEGNRKYGSTRYMYRHI